MEEKRMRLCACLTWSPSSIATLFTSVKTALMINPEQTAQLNSIAPTPPTDKHSFLIAHTNCSQKIVDKIEKVKKKLVFF